MGTTNESCLTQDAEIARLKRYEIAGEEAIFILSRIVWQLSDGVGLSGGRISDTTYDLAVALLERTKVAR